MRTIGGHLSLEAMHMGAFLAGVLTTRVPEKGSSVHEWILYALRGLLSCACASMGIYHLWAILVRKGNAEYGRLWRVVWTEFAAYCGVVAILLIVYAIGIFGALWAANQPFCQSLVDLVTPLLRTTQHASFPLVMDSWEKAIDRSLTQLKAASPWNHRIQTAVMKYTMKTFVPSISVWQWLQGPELWRDFKQRTFVLLTTFLTDLERPHYISFGAVTRLAIGTLIATVACIALVWLTARPTTRLASDQAGIHPKSFSLACMIGATTFMGVFGAEAFLHLLQGYGQYIWGSEYEKAVRLHRFLQHDQERALTYIASVLTALVTAIALVRVPTVPSPPKHEVSRAFKVVS